MDIGDDQARTGPRLVAVQIADEPEAWAAAGFRVVGDLVRVGAVDLRLVGHPESDVPRGITGWTIEGVTVASGHLDGLPTAGHRADRAEPDPSTSGPTTPEPGSAPAAGSPPVTFEPASHPNGATKVDHVVVLTPDLDRTIDACAAAGLELRRIRETTSHGSPMRQAFFRLGPTILEVVSGDAGTGVPAADAPATWFGLAVDVADLDETAAFLGDGLGPIKVAVQDGRRIATLRHKRFGMSVAVAVMDDLGER